MSRTIRPRVSGAENETKNSSENTETRLHEERRALQVRLEQLPPGPEQDAAKQALFKVERAVRKRNLPLLAQVQVASPCPERWEEMGGGDKQRFCNLCEKNVHNLSAMTRQEAEEFLRATQNDDICISYFRRRDGHIMTSDCGPGKKLRARQRQKSALLAGASWLAAGAAAACSPSQDVRVTGEFAPLIEKQSIPQASQTSDETASTSDLEAGEAPPPGHPDFTADLAPEPPSTREPHIADDHEANPDAENPNNPINPADENPTVQHPMVRGRRAPIHRTTGAPRRVLGRPI